MNEFSRLKKQPTFNREDILQETDIFLYLF